MKSIIFASLLLIALPARADLDRSKLPPTTRQAMDVQKPAGSATFENLRIGQFYSAAADGEKPVVRDGKAWPQVRSGKGVFAPVPCNNNAPRTVRWRNCWFGQICAGSNHHLEGMYIVTDRRDVNTQVVIEDCVFEDIQGGGVFIDYGSSGAFVLRHLDFSGIAYPGDVMIGLMAGSTLSLTLEDVDGRVVLNLDRLSGQPATAVLKEIVVVGQAKGSIGALQGGHVVPVPVPVRYVASGDGGTTGGPPVPQTQNAGGTAVPATRSAEAEISELRSQISDLEAKLAAIRKVVGE